MRILFFLIFCTYIPISAQKNITVPLPDVYIKADQLLRGDGDTYGIGDWNANFTATLDGSHILLTGTIAFTEKANDFTTIVGTYSQRIKVEQLETCSHCQVILDESYGAVSGPNIGARGYRWFEGQGLIRRAWVQTDTFGEDTGNIGGNIQFAPLRFLVHCDIAMVGE